MGWFKRLNNGLVRSNAALSFGTDADGKQMVIGTQAQLTRATGGLDTNFGAGSPSAYGKGSIVMLPAGGIRTVDADGYWQTVTIGTASPSVSPSAWRPLATSATTHARLSTTTRG